MSLTHAVALDVVVVPDFTEPRAAKTFEDRSLLFLGSWLEHAARTDGLALHVACIGEPPETVRRLAATCGASVTIHEPVRAAHGRTCNKLRGLEVGGRADRILLVDVDVVLLDGIGALADLPSGIAAAPTDQPKIPLRCWERIYPALGMPLPTERVHALIERWSPPPAPSAADGDPRDGVLPAHNAGVVLLPRACALREVWEDHIRRIGSLFDESDDAWGLMSRADQGGFATAVEWLKRCGVPFVRLPDRYHARPAHLVTRALPLAQAAMFHCYRIFRQRAPAGASTDLRLRLYEIGLVRLLLELWRGDGRRALRPARVARSLVPAMLDAHRLVGRLRRIYRARVLPVLERGERTRAAASVTGAG